MCSVEYGSYRLVPDALNISPDHIVGGPDRSIVVELFGDGMLLGGMSYHVDQDMTKPAGRLPSRPSLAGCRRRPPKLSPHRLPRGVKKIVITKVTVDIVLV
jgi:hypothetical protein